MVVVVDMPRVRIPHPISQTFFRPCKGVANSLHVPSIKLGGCLVPVDVVEEEAVVVVDLPRVHILRWTSQCDSWCIRVLV